MEETRSDSHSSFLNLVSQNWIFILVTVFVPLALNVIALVRQEINHQLISNYRQTFKSFGVTTQDPWNKLIFQVGIVLLLTICIGFLVIFLIKTIIDRIKHVVPRIILVFIIIVTSAFLYSICSQIIDVFWSSAFRTGPTIGVPMSSLSRINSMISFSIIVCIYIAYYSVFEIRLRNTGQPNPRSTRPL